MGSQVAPVLLDLQPVHTLAAVHAVHLYEHVIHDPLLKYSPTSHDKQEPAVLQVLQSELQALIQVVADPEHVPQTVFVQTEQAVLLSK